MKKKRTIGILVAIIGILGASFLFVIDKKSSAEKVPKSQKTDIPKATAKEMARKERECVAVEFKQLHSLISELRSRDSDFQEIGNPLYVSNEGITTISVEKVTAYGRQKLLVDDNKDGRWKDYYTGNELHLPTQVVDNDTVVEFPAYIFALLIQLSEPKR